MEGLERLRALRIVPVIQIKNPDQAAELGRALTQGGLPCAEITFRTPGAEEALRRMVQAFPDMTVGAGTILTAEQADRAVQAGAAFIVSPGLNPEVVRFCQEKGIAVLPGCVTPTEIGEALRLGLKAVKFFPAEASGGLPMLKALRAPYSQMEFMPTGGISPENVRDYLSSPGIFACGGSWMVKEEWLSAGRFDLIQEAVREASRLAGGAVSAKTVWKSADALNKEQKKYDLAVLGEVLLRLSCGEGEKLPAASGLQASVGGAEFNVASGISQLGLESVLITKVPSHAVSGMVRWAMKASGVSEEYLIGDSRPEARLGIYYFQPGALPRKPSVVYDRKFSSMTSLEPEEIPNSWTESARMLHLSGITLAVDEKTRRAAMETVRRFRRAGAEISFDVNYRASLWSEAEAKQAVEEILPLADYLFISEESCRRMFGRTGELGDVLKGFCQEYGLKAAASTRREALSPREHRFTSLLYHSGTDTLYTEPPYSPITVEDRIGSGDSFVAGALYGLLQYGDGRKAVEYGNAMAALKCTVKGDLPDTSLSEAESVIREHKSQGPRSEMER